MSDTRQVWKPWRANTRTAASRMTRRLSTACLDAATLRRDAREGRMTGVGRRGCCLLIPSIRLGAAVGQRGERAADLGLLGEVELRDDERLGVGRRGERDPPRVDDHRAPTGADALRVLA